jgi:hypothetical protein
MLHIGNSGFRKLQIEERVDLSRKASMKSDRSCENGSCQEALRIHAMTVVFRRQKDKHAIGGEVVNASE